LGHAQVGDSDEVAASPEAPCSTFGLLQQPVHGLDEGVAAVIHHPSDHRREALLERGGELLEGRQAAAPRPAQPSVEVRACLLDAVVQARSRVHLAQRHLQPPRPRTLERGAAKRPAHMPTGQHHQHTL